MLPSLTVGLLTPYVCRQIHEANSIVHRDRIFRMCGKKCRHYSSTSENGFLRIKGSMPTQLTFAQTTTDLRKLPLENCFRRHSRLFGFKRSTQSIATYLSRLCSSNSRPTMCTLRRPGRYVGQQGESSPLSPDSWRFDQTCDPERRRDLWKRLYRACSWL
jgi:hypothetical protein